MNFELFNFKFGLVSDKIELRVEVEFNRDFCDFFFYL